MIESASLSFENLCYSVESGLFHKTRKPKQILKGVSGAFNDNELSIIMGVSGSGKSSLLNILSGFKQREVSGSIKINGNAVTSTDVRKISSYVMQENKLHRFLTVYETMMFAASFKTKSDHNERDKKVQGILLSLGMSEILCRMVEHLSGGQQKRLSIAVELVDDPSILFLDEPSTGLDSSSATQCIRLLKTLANEGKTVVCTIHTPSALLFKMFDHVYTLHDGYCIYQGSSASLVPFLQELNLCCPPAYNPSDFLIEVASNGTENDRLIARIYNGNNHEYRKTLSRIVHSDDRSIQVNRTSASSSIYRLSFTQQVKNLVNRNFLISKRDRTLVLMRLWIHVAMGFVFGFLYSGVGDEASRFFDNYRYIIVSIVFQLYTSYFSLQTYSESEWK